MKVKVFKNLKIYLIYIYIILPYFCLKNINWVLFPTIPSLCSCAISAIDNTLGFWTLPKCHLIGKVDLSIEQSVQTAKHTVKSEWKAAYMARCTDNNKRPVAFLWNRIISCTPITPDLTKERPGRCEKLSPEGEGWRRGSEAQNLYVLYESQ